MRIDPRKVHIVRPQILPVVTVKLHLRSSISNYLCTNNSLYNDNLNNLVTNHLMTNNIKHLLAASLNTEEKLFQISSSPILTRLQKARAGLGLGKWKGLGLSMLLSEGKAVLVLVGALAVV